MALAPESLLATALDTALSTLTLGTNLFSGPVQPAGDGIPAECVFVHATGGPAPTDYIGETKVHRYLGVMVRVRGDRDDYDGGLTLARSVRDSAHFAALTGCLDCRVQESEPNYLGEDTDGLPEWSINIEIQAKE